MSNWARLWRASARTWAIAIVCSAVAAHAQTITPPTIVDLRVGFAGKFKVARWTPVEVTFQGGSESVVGQVHLTLPDGDGTPTVVSSPRPVQILAGRPTKALLYAKFGARYGSMRVSLDVDHRQVVTRDFDMTVNGPPPLLPLPLTDDESLVVTLGQTIGVEDAARLHQQATGRQIEIAKIDDVAALPTEWYGYDGVDWLVIATSQSEQFSQLLDTGARRAALEEWIHLGGKLLLTVGVQAPTVLAADAALAGFAPGTFVESATIRRTTDLESFVGGSRKVPHPTGRELALAVPRLNNVVGRVEIADGKLPLVVRAPRRLGEIVFVGVDLDQQPFIDWEGRGALVGRLLGLSDPSTTNTAAQNKISNFGQGNFGSDLLGQLRRGLDEFRGVTTISFAIVAALILGYIVLIGPGDYFLVKSVLKRMELTWITFPLWVLLVSGGAYALAIYTKGDALRLNQLDLVDVDVASGQARATSWFNLFSPRSQVFDLAAVPQLPSGKPVEKSERLFAWLGSGAADLGGGTLFGGQYSFAPSLDAMLNVPVQVWSTKGFLSRSSYQISELPTANFELGPDGVPEGTVRNALTIPLEDCLLFSGRWAYLLGTLQPGQSAPLRPGEQRDLEHVLRHPGQWSEQVPKTTAAGGETDLRATLDMMMFYEAAGGNALLNSDNDAERFVDLSDLLPLDRAILVGRAQAPASQLMNDGEPLAGPEDRHWTVYRFVFPVARRTSGRDAN